MTAVTTETFGNHYCIQATRIEKMDGKLDEIDKKLDDLVSMSGPVSKVAQQVERLTTLIENGNNKKRLPDEAWKWLGLSILILAAVIAALLGVDIPG